MITKLIQKIKGQSDAASAAEGSAGRPDKSLADMINLHSTMMYIRHHLSIPKIIQSANILLIINFVWMAGSLAAKVVEHKFMNVPVSKVKFIPERTTVKNTPLQFHEFQPIITQNIFNAEVTRKKVEAPKPVTPTPVINRPVSASLSQIINNLQLMGVYKGVKLFAIIHDKRKRSEELFTINDKLFATEAYVSNIDTKSVPQKVYITLGGDTGTLSYTVDEKNKLLATTQPRQARSVAPSTSRRKTPEPVGATNSYTKNGKDYFIRSAEVDRELNNFSKLLNQARVVPFFKNGAHQGYQIKSIDKNSLYDRLGLKNNDIIKTINGETIDSPEKAFSLLKMLRNEREINLSIERRGRPTTLNYFIN